MYRFPIPSAHTIKLSTLTHTLTLSACRCRSIAIISSHATKNLSRLIMAGVKFRGIEFMDTTFCVNGTQQCFECSYAVKDQFVFLGISIFGEELETFVKCQEKEMEEFVEEREKLLNFMKRRK